MNHPCKIKPTGKKGILTKQRQADYLSILSSLKTKQGLNCTTLSTFIFLKIEFLMVPMVDRLRSGMFNVQHFSKFSDNEQFKTVVFRERVNRLFSNGPRSFSDIVNRFQLEDGSFPWYVYLLALFSWLCSRAPGSRSLKKTNVLSKTITDIFNVAFY